jgi:hypothetical protein
MGNKETKSSKRPVKITLNPLALGRQLENQSFEDYFSGIIK